MFKVVAEARHEPSDCIHGLTSPVCKGEAGRMRFINWGLGFISFHFSILQGQQFRVSSHRVTRMLVIQRITMPATISRGESDLRCCIMIAVW